MALTKDTAIEFEVKLSGATAPVTATIGGTELATQPVRDGLTDFYTIELSADENANDITSVRLTDAAGETWGLTIIPDGDFATGEDVTNAVTAIQGADGDTLKDLSDEIAASSAPTVEEIDAELTTNHGSGGWTTGGTPVITDGVTITPETLGTDGEALGVVMPYGVISVYLSTDTTDPQYQFDADADGEYSFEIPSGSVWTLIARRYRYETTSAEVSTEDEVS